MKRQSLGRGSDRGLESELAHHRRFSEVVLSMEKSEEAVELKINIVSLCAPYRLDDCCSHCLSWHCEVCVVEMICDLLEICLLRVFGYQLVLKLRREEASSISISGRATNGFRAQLLSISIPVIARLRMAHKCTNQTCTEHRIEGQLWHYVSAESIIVI